MVYKNSLSTDSWFTFYQKSIVFFRHAANSVVYDEPGYADRSRPRGNLHCPYLICILGAVPHKMEDLARRQEARRDRQNRNHR